MVAYDTSIPSSLVRSRSCERLQPLRSLASWMRDAACLFSTSQTLIEDS